MTALNLAATIANRPVGVAKSPSMTVAMDDSPYPDQAGDQQEQSKAEADEQADPEPIRAADAVANGCSGDRQQRGAGVGQPYGRRRGRDHRLESLEVGVELFIRFGPVALVVGDEPVALGAERPVVV